MAEMETLTSLLTTPVPDSGKALFNSLLFSINLDTDLQPFDPLTLNAAFLNEPFGLIVKLLPAQNGQVH